MLNLHHHSCQNVVHLLDEVMTIIRNLDEVITIIRNLVRSSMFSESVICPVAPMFCGNLAKIVKIEGKKTDLGILQFLRLSGPDDLPGSQSGVFR